MMNEEILLKEVIHNALYECVSKDDSRFVMNHPHQVDDMIYATNGYLIMEVGDRYAQEVPLPEGYRFPNVKAFVCQGYEPIGVVNVDEDMEKYDSLCFVKIDDVLIRMRDYQNVIRVARMMGAKHLRVSRSVGKNVTMFHADHFWMYVMSKEFEDEFIPVEIDTMMLSRDSDLSLNLEEGMAYCKNLQEEREAARKAIEEERAKGPKYYDVTLVKYATVTVEAYSQEEAEEIAQENWYDVDFDDCEVDQTEELDEVGDYTSRVLTKDGFKKNDNRK